MSDYQRYLHLNELMRTNLFNLPNDFNTRSATVDSQQSYTHPLSSSDSLPHPLPPQAPASPTDCNSALFGKSAFYSSDDQLFGANERGQTFLSSDDDAAHAFCHNHDPFVCDASMELKQEDICHSIVQSEAGKQVVVKDDCLEIKIEEVASSELSENELPKRKKRRRRGRRGKSRSKSKTASKPELYVKPKRQLKRKRNSFDGESNAKSSSDSSASPSVKPKRATKRRKVQSNASMNGISRCVDDYIEETMSTKECRVIFVKMQKNNEVTCTGDDGNWCHIGECAAINKCYGKKCHLKRHVDEMHIGRRFRCTFPGCVYDAKGKTFRQKGPAKEHINNTHFGVDSLWKCCFCGDKFSRWNGVKRHLVLRRCKFVKKQFNAQKKQEIIDKAESGELQMECKNF